MSVRRLAEVQPDSFAFTAESQAKADWWIAKYPAERKQSASIPLLWLVQKQEGWVSEPAIRYLAAMLDMPVIRVLEVATFYTMFQLTPVGRVAFVQLCGTTPCSLMGVNDLKAVLKAKIGAPGHLSDDGRFSWEEVECLGACCNAPMAAINDYYYEDLTPETLTQILDDFAAGKAPKPGSYNGRKASEPKDKIQTLTDPALYDGSAAKPIVPAEPAATGTRCVTLEGQKTRLMLMLAVNAACFVLAAAAIVGHLVYGLAWLLPVFVAFIGAGVGALVWFVMGIAQSSSLAGSKLGEGA